MRHLMLAVHSTQRTPRLLPGRVVATTASAGWVRPQVPEPCWQRSRPRISRHTLDHQESPTRRRCSSSYASWQPKKQSRPNAQRGRARGLDVTPVSVWGCVFIPVTISNASGHHAGTLIAQPVRFTKTPISMLSLLCPAALAEYDKCDRPAGKWAGFDQVSQCPRMCQCATAPVPMYLAPCLVLQGIGRSRGQAVVFTNNHVYVGGYGCASPFAATDHRWHRSAAVYRVSWQVRRALLWQLDRNR